LKIHYERIFANKNKILVVFAHPDDLELYCGGTVARLIADEKKVRSIKMTSGEMGSRQEKITTEELQKIREKEDAESMETLGIKSEDNIYLRIGDGRVENNIDVIGQLAKQIRIFQPDLIITHNPEDVVVHFEKDVNWFNHRDHRHTGQVVIDASYPYARDILFFPEHFQDINAKSWTCTEFLLVDYYQHPDSVHIDVTNTVEKRIRAHSCHSSQYSVTDAKNSADFFTCHDDYPKGKRSEQFRYIITD